MLQESSKLNKEELIVSMTDEICNKQEVKKYYDLLPLNVLQQKAGEMVIVRDCTETTAFELKYRNYLMNKPRKVVPTIIHNCSTSRAVKDNKWESFCTEIWKLPCVDKATVIAPGIIGVTTDDKSRTQRFLRKMGFDGEVIWND